MIVDKKPYWDKLVDHFYDNVKWEKNIDNIYDWLEQEYDVISHTGDTTLNFNDEKKAMWFVMRWS